MQPGTPARLTSLPTPHHACSPRLPIPASPCQPAHASWAWDGLPSLPSLPMLFVLRSVTDEPEQRGPPSQSSPTLVPVCSAGRCPRRGAVVKNNQEAVVIDNQKVIQITKRLSRHCR